MYDIPVDFTCKLFTYSIYIYIYIVYIYSIGLFKYQISSKIIKYSLEKVGIFQSG